MVIAHILKIHKMKGSLLETEWLPLDLPLPWPHLFLPTAPCTSFRPLPLCLNGNRLPAPSWPRTQICLKASWREVATPFSPQLQAQPGRGKWASALPRLLSPPAALPPPARLPERCQITFSGVLPLLGNCLHPQSQLHSPGDTQRTSASPPNVCHPHVLLMIKATVKFTFSQQLPHWPPRPGSSSSTCSSLPSLKETIL